MPRYVVFGEALTDMIQQQPGLWRAVPGGSCWNVARVGARLGVDAAYAGAVSRDTFGDELAAGIANAGLDMRFLQRVSAAPLLSIVASSKPPSYFFIGENSADLAFEPARLPRGWREAAEVVHFGGISLARVPLAERLVNEAQAVKAAGKCVAFDPNFREPMRAPSYRGTFSTMVQIADFIKVSAEDLLGLFPEQTVGAGLAALKNLAPSATILLTQGADGMTLFTGQSVIGQSAFKVDVVDTVGCGDAAMGAWMAARFSIGPNEYAEHLVQAAATSALVATRSGPYAPLLDEVKTFISARRSAHSMLPP